MATVAERMLINVSLVSLSVDGKSCPPDRLLPDAGLTNQTFFSISLVGLVGGGGIKPCPRPDIDEG